MILRIGGHQGLAFDQDSENHGLHVVGHRDAGNAAPEIHGSYVNDTNLLQRGINSHERNRRHA